MVLSADSRIKETMNRHISEQFDEELQSARTLLMEMGGLLEQQLKDAREALLRQNSEKALLVLEVEKQVNRLEKELDEQCIQILARRQPAASDLRMMIAVLRATNDLERIGDEAKRIATLALKSGSHVFPDDHYVEIDNLMERVQGMVAQASMRSRVQTWTVPWKPSRPTLKSIESTVRSWSACYRTCATNQIRSSYR